MKSFIHWIKQKLATCLVLVIIFGLVSIDSSLATDFNMGGDFPLYADSSGEGVNLSWKDTPQGSNTYSVYRRQSISSGKLIIEASEDTPSGSIVISGAKDQLTTIYKFTAEKENFTIKTLTFVNDLEGVFDKPTATDAIELITIDYFDSEGNIETISGTLDYKGQVTFSDLDLYIETEVPTEILIKVDTAPNLSGDAYRIGILEDGNTTETFSAVGEDSLMVQRNTEIINTELLQPFVLRQSRPLISSDVDLSSFLSMGNNTLYGFMVSAEGNNDLSFSRLTFDIIIENLDDWTDDIKKFKFFRDEENITSEVSIYCVSNHDPIGVDVKGYLGLADCDGIPEKGVSDGVYKIIVAFEEEEIIPLDDFITFHLEAAVKGVDGAASIYSELTHDDDLTSLNTPDNTAKVFVAGDDNAIFSGSSNDFSTVSNPGTNIIWSDHSDLNHEYPTILFGNVTSNTGSSDWTNGYLLNLDNLSNYDEYSLNPKSSLSKFFASLLPVAKADVPGFTKLDTLRGTSYRDITGEVGGSYDYIIEAFNTNGDSLGYSEVVSGVTYINEPKPVFQDFPLTADNLGEGINLLWKDVPPSSTKYNVYRRQSVPSGKLTIEASENSPKGSIVIADGHEQLASAYTLIAKDESFTVNTITIINDLDGPFNRSIPTTAVETVIMDYFDTEGNVRTVTGSLNEVGSITFTNLDLFVEQKSKAEVLIKVDTVAGLSGPRFRLGIQEYGNTKETFSAVGGASLNAIISPTVLESDRVKMTQLRKSRPYFLSLAVPQTLKPDKNILYSFQTKADSAGPITLARAVLEMEVLGMENNFDSGAEIDDLIELKDLFDFRVYREDFLIPKEHVNIYCAVKDQSAALDIQNWVTMDDCDGRSGDGIQDGIYSIIISFNEEQIIAAGKSNIFRLEANLVGLDEMFDSNVKVRLADGDDYHALWHMDYLTGKVFIPGDSKYGLFTTNSYSFRQDLLAGMNIVWSDQSSFSHFYPDSQFGEITPETGSNDYTNGYLLHLKDQAESIIKTSDYSLSRPFSFFKWIPKAKADTAGFELIKSTSGNSFRDVTGEVGAVYDYRIEALDSKSQILGYSQMVSKKYLYNPKQGYYTVENGEMLLPKGVNTIETDTPIDFTNGIAERVSDNQVNLSGELTSLFKYKGGSLSDYDLSNEIAISDVSLKIQKAIRLTSGIDSESIRITDTLTPATLWVKDKTTLFGGDKWDGIFSAPTSDYPRGIIPSSLSHGENVLFIGSSDNTLISDRAIGIIMEDVGEYIGYRLPESNVWQRISSTCTGSFSHPEAPDFPDSCVVIEGDTAKILTYHTGYFGDFISKVEGSESVLLGDPNSRLSEEIKYLNETIQSSAVILSKISVADEMIELDNLNHVNSVAFTGERGLTLLKAGNDAVLSALVPISTFLFTPNDWDKTISPPHLISKNEMNPKGERVNNDEEYLKRTNIDLLISMGGEGIVSSRSLTITIPIHGDKAAVFVKNKGEWERFGEYEIHNDEIVFETTSFDQIAVRRLINTDLDVTFTDIQDHWAKEYIMRLAKKGIVTGRTADTFDPEARVTRAEMIKMAVVAFDLNVPEGVSGIPYEDVSESSWYLSYVQIAKEVGVLQGIADENLLNPNEQMVRAGTIKMLLLAANIEDIDDHFYSNYVGKNDWWYIFFPDVLIKQWYAKYVAYALDHDIIGGYQDQTFRPYDPITRAEVCKVIVKLLELKGE